VLASPLLVADLFGRCCRSYSYAEMIGNLRVGLNALALLPHFSPAMPYRFTRRRESRRRIEPDARYEHARSSFGALTVLSADDLLVEDMPGEPGRAGFSGVRFQILRDAVVFLSL